MDDRLIKPIRAPLLLKDHLLEDMSSCSSNGFKSFPRRQCCTTVTFRRREKSRPNFVKPPPNPALSALQTVITAVKRLHFGAAEKMKKNDLSSSFFLFWRRKPERKEIGRWKSFEQLMKEDEWRPPAEDRKSCSSDFTASEGGNSSSNLPPRLKNDVVMTPHRGVEITNEADSTTCSGGTSDNNSSTQTKKQWTSDQEKEQFSPVSVLDCPFDEEDEVSSPFQHRLALMEGTRKKLLKKIQRFECLAKLEPLNLTIRFESQLESDNESSTFLDEEEIGEEESDDEEDDDEALELVDQVKTIMPSYGLKFKADKLMLDFFRERISNDQECTSHEKQRGESLSHNVLVEIARGWMDGHDPLGLFMEWEVEKNRKAYVEDMEHGGEWKRLDQEYKKVVLELEIEVCDALLNEVLLEIMN